MLVDSLYLHTANQAKTGTLASHLIDVEINLLHPTSSYIDIGETSLSLNYSRS